VPSTAPETREDGGSRRLRSWRGEVASFSVIGIAFNVVYGLLYVALRGLLGPQWSNLVSLVASTVTDTATNRRVTFGVRNRATVVPHQSLGLVLLGLGLAVTSGSLWLLQAVAPDAGRLAELAVLGLANLLVGVVRFLSFRRWMRP
jgi:putative flippase GtrA